MNPRRQSFSAIAAAVASAILISCGEMAVRVKGRLIDGAGSPRENCIVTVAYRGQTVGEFRVSGTFDETAVFRPSSPDPLTVRGSCYGSRASFEKEIRRVPEKFNNPVDLGDVVLP
jgi:hypothetical protein